MAENWRIRGSLQFPSTVRRGGQAYYYQVKMAKAYANEHLQEDGGYEILISEDLDG